MIMKLKICCIVTLECTYDSAPGAITFRVVHRRERPRELMFEWMRSRVPGYSGASFIIFASTRAEYDCLLDAYLGRCGKHNW